MAEPKPTPIPAKEVQPEVDTRAETECSERSNPAKHDANDTTSELQNVAGKKDRTRSPILKPRRLSRPSSLDYTKLNLLKRNRSPIARPRSPTTRSRKERSPIQRRGKEAPSSHIIDARAEKQVQTD